MRYYYMNIECGNLVTADEIYEDALENGYDDITDPTSCEYGNYKLHYSKTNYPVINEFNIEND